VIEKQEDTFVKIVFALNNAALCEPKTRETRRKKLSLNKGAISCPVDEIADETF
jgi:hypothetical protein